MNGIAMVGFFKVLRNAIGNMRGYSPRLLKLQCLRKKYSPICFLVSLFHVSTVMMNDGNSDNSMQNTRQLLLFL
eukprot:GSA25T00013021001.1